MDVRERDQPLVAASVVPRQHPPGDESVKRLEDRLVALYGRKLLAELLFFLLVRLRIRRGKEVGRRQLKLIASDNDPSATHDGRDGIGRVIWLASSKMTTSNGGSPAAAGNNWLTTSGLITQQGLSAPMTFGALYPISRTGLCPILRAACCCTRVASSMCSSRARVARSATARLTRVAVVSI